MQSFRATAGRETASDLIGEGMCQIVVDLYVKAKAKGLTENIAF